MKVNIETGLKRCPKCKRELTPDNFYSNKDTSDGLSLYCKDCRKTHAKEYQKRKGYYYNKTEAHKKSQYKYSQSEKGRIQIQRANQKSNDSGYKKSWVKNRRNADLNFKIRTSLRTRFNHMIVDYKLYKWNSSLLYIGCSVEFVMKYLESQFQEGMTWENYGEWHVDHKIPLNYFDLTIEENLYIAWNYRNLQPLWGRDNLKKSDSVPENVEQLVEQLKKEINDNN